MPTDRRRRKEDAGISPFKDPTFRRASVYFDDIEYQRRFEQNLIRYGILSKAQVTKEITTAVGGGGGGGGGWCYWTKEGSNLVYYGGNVGVGVHPHSNDFEVRGNVLVEAVAEQPYVEIRNWSDTEYDPVIHWSVGATPAKKYTMGVDDSDADAWLLCTGDILTSVVTAASYTMNRAYDGNLFVVDTNNQRLKKHLSSDLMTYISEIGSYGTGDDNFDTPQAICNDGTYLYICDRANHRIVKRKVSDLSYVAETGSLGAGVDDFNTPWGICTDGTHLYITDLSNNRIKKHLCADLSYVSSATVADSNPLDPHDFNQPRAICTDGTYLYITQNSGATCRLIILLCSTLADILQIHDDGHIDAGILQGICVTGGYLYISNMGNCDSIGHVYKYAASSLSYVTHWGVYGTGVGQMTSAIAIDTDGTTLWIFDYGGLSNNNRIMKFLLDGTYVATYGTYGDGDTNFYYANGLSLGGTISFTTALYRAPILKAGLDGSYVDAYPLFRARDGFQLMEDGTVAATAYVGLYAPAAITASYALTFPGTGPAAAGHFAVSAAGLITWGQDLIATASPTFAGLTLTGLTASHPVFTDASKVLVSTGTVPVDHGGTGLAVYAVGDLIYASATTTLARLADVAVASYLRSGGVGVAPLWSTLKLPNAATAYRLPVATSANTIGEVAAVGATGEYLKGNTGAIPSWATLNQAAIAGLTTIDNPLFQGLTIGGPRLAGYAHRILIALPIPTADLVDFPVKIPIVAGSPASIAIGAACRADGFDIRFTAIDGVTLLPYERESFAVVAGEASGIFWGKSGAAMAGTYIWCYYGNPAAPDVSTAIGDWTVTGQCAITNPAKIEKVGGTGGFDSQFYSNQGYADACAVMFNTGLADCTLAIGLNAAPDADSDFATIDYCWYLSWPGGIAKSTIYENGSWKDDPGVFTTATIFKITYDGVNVRWYMGGVLKRTVARAVGATLYADSAFYTPGAAAERIAFGSSEAWVDFAEDNYVPADGGLTWGAEEVLNIEVDGDVDVTGVFRVDGVQVLKEQQAAIANLNATYIAGELDTEAEIITAINATNAKINAILAMHRAHGIIAT